MQDAVGACQEHVLLPKGARRQLAGASGLYLNMLAHLGLAQRHKQNPSQRVRQRELKL